MATFNSPLKPFTLPNFATIARPPGKRDDGFVALPTISVNELPRETLEAMCADFTRAMLQRWEKANDGK